MCLALNFPSLLSTSIHPDQARMRESAMRRHREIVSWRNPVIALEGSGGTFLGIAITYKRKPVPLPSSLLFFTTFTLKSNNMSGRSTKLQLLCFLLSFCFIATFTTASPVDTDKLQQRDDEAQHVKRQNLAPVRAAALTSTTTSRLAPVRLPATTSSKSTVRTTSTSSRSSSRTTSTTKRSTSTSIKRSTATSPAATSTAPANTAFSSNILQAHNSARSTHGANALTWSTSAEALAKTWAEKCVW
jgi:hypothetical protein